MQLFYVYILKCRDGSYYIGHTDNLEQRLQEHQSVLFKGYTAPRRPVQLVFAQEFESRDEAFMIERKLKRWTRLKKEAVISGEFGSLRLLSKKKFIREDY
jgi:predicted GIY-YIG superfamily endonuclease